MLTWDEVENSKTYREGSPVLQGEMRKSYFDMVLSKDPDFGKLPSEAKERIRVSFSPRIEEMSPVSRALAGGAMGAKLSAAAALEPITFGVSKQLGLDKEKIKEEIKQRGFDTEYGKVPIPFSKEVTGEQINVPVTATGVTDVASTLTGFATVLPSLLERGAAPVIEKLAKGGSEAFKNILKWGVAGGEFGALSQSAEESFNAMKKKSPGLGQALDNIMVRTASDALGFMAFELGLAAAKATAPPALKFIAKQLNESPVIQERIRAQSKELLAAHPEAKGIEWMQPKKSPTMAPEEEMIVGQNPPKSYYEQAPSVYEPKPIEPQGPTMIVEPGAQPRPFAQIATLEPKADPDALIDTVSSYSVRSPQRQGAIKRMLNAPSKEAPVLESKIETPSAGKPDYKAIVEEAGAKFDGLWPPRVNKKGETVEGLVQFTDNKGFTMALKPSEFSLKNVKAKMAEKELQRTRVADARPTNAPESVNVGLAAQGDAASIATLQLKVNNWKAMVDGATAAGHPPQVIAVYEKGLKRAQDALDVATAKFPEPKARQIIYNENPTPENASAVLEKPTGQSAKVIQDAASTNYIKRQEPEIVMSDEPVSTASDPITANFIIEREGLGRSSMNMEGLTKDDIVKIASDLREKGSATFRGEKIFRLMDWKKVVGDESGAAYVPSASDINRVKEVLGSKKGLVNFLEEETTLSDAFKRSTFFKKLSLPFWLGEKFPAFKPITDELMWQLAKNNERQFQGWAQLNEKEFFQLPKESQEKVINAMMAGDSLDGRTKLRAPDRSGSIDPISGQFRYYWNQKELKELFGLNESEVRAAQNIINTMLHLRAVKIETLKRETGFYEFAQLPNETPEAFAQRKKLAIEKLNERAEVALDGYMPHYRKGNYVVYVAPENAGEPARYSQLVDVGMFSKGKAREYTKKVAEHLGVPESEVQLFHTKDWSARSPQGLSFSFLNDVLEAVGEKAPDVMKEAYEFMKDDIKQAYYKEIMPRLMHRNNVPGFGTDPAEVISAIHQELVKASTRLSAVESRSFVSSYLNQNKQNISPALYNMGIQYLNSYMAPSSPLWKVIHKLMYARALGGKASFAFVNLTQPLFTTWGEIGRYYGGQTLATTERKFFDAYRKGYEYIKGTNKEKNAELFSFLDRMRQMGQLGDIQIRYLLGEDVQGPVANWYQKAGHYTDVALRAFGKYTEYVNRTHSAIAAFDIGKNKLGLSGDELLRFAINFNNRTQFAYGASNIPIAISQAGWMARPLRAAYAFKSFNQNMLHLFSDMIRRRDLGQLSRTLGTLGVLGGASSVPFAGLYSDLMRRQGIDPETEFREKSGLPTKVADVLVKGAPTIAGVDLSRAIGYGDIVQLKGVEPKSVLGSVGKSLAEQTYLSRLGQDLFDGIEAMSQGDMVRAAEKLTPAGAAKLATAYRTAVEGLRNKGGDLLLGADKIDGWDTVLQGAGFQPIKFSDIYQQGAAMNALQTYRSNESSAVMDQYQKLLASGKRQEAAQLIRDFNAEQRSKSKERRVYVTSQMLKNARVRATHGKMISSYAKAIRPYAARARKVYSSP